MTTRILPEAAVHEYLGVQRTGGMPTVAVNVGTLNALGRKWADVRDLERMLRVFANREGHPLLHSVANQLVEASGLDPIRET